MVSVPPQQNYPFPEAAIMFDLERLKTDLERYEEVTDTPWQYFLGILSGYSPEEIASRLGIEKTTVKQSLTQRLKPSLIELLDLPEDTRIYWDHRIIKQLISAGYGLSEREICINLGREIFKDMLDKQRELTANPLINANFEASKLYVPLGLVESKKQERRKDVSPEMGSRLYRPEEYEITRQFENDEFLTEVLLQGNSPKSQGKRIAIIGEPGSGKTTRLQQIADRLFNENDQNLVIWVSLADLQDRNLENFLLNNWLKVALKQKEASEESQNELIEKFNEGNVWLLLDGLDEMVLDSNPLYWVNSQIKGWIESAKVILTCRVNVWKSGNNYLSNFDVYENLPSSESQRDEFIYKFFTDRNLADQLITELNRDGKERIRDLVKNPLRLTLVCYSWENHQGSLPETKAGLYKECVEAFYQWNEVYFKTTITQRKALNQALGELAKKALEQESSKFRLTKSFICEVLGESDEGLFKLALDLGWLNRVGVAEENPSEQVYAFFHPSFQEYFAALAIDDDKFFLNHNNENPSAFEKHNERNCVYRIFDSQWEETFLIWLGSQYIDNERKRKILTNLINFNEMKGYSFLGFRKKCFFLSASGILEFPDLQNSTIYNEVFDQLIKWGDSESLKHLSSMSYIRPEYSREIIFKLIEDSFQTTPDSLNEILLIIEALSNILTSQDRKRIKSFLEKILYGFLRIFEYEHGYCSDMQDVPNCFSAKNSPNINTIISCSKKIYSDYSKIVRFLENLLEFSQFIKNKDHQFEFFSNLLQIDPSNLNAINTLHYLIKNSKCEHTIHWSCELLLQSNQNTKDVIETLHYLLKNSTDDEINYWSYLSLSEFNQYREIDLFSDMINHTNEGMLSWTLNRLTTLNPNNPKLLEEINSLLNNMKVTEDESDKQFIAECFSEVEHYLIDQRLIIKTLLEESQKDKDFVFFISSMFYLVKMKSPCLDQKFDEIRALINNFIFRGLTHDEYDGIGSTLYVFDYAVKRFPYSDICSDIVKLMKFRLLTKGLDVMDNSLIDTCINNMCYPEFYKAWHSEPEIIHPEILEISPLGNTAITQTLNQQILDLPSQLQPTEKTYPLIINAQSLEDETDNSSIAQELCNQIYAIAFPDETNIPEINNAPQLKRLIPNIKKQLGTKNLALIFHNGEPNESLIKFCKKLSDSIHIKWITEQSIKIGIPPQENLVNILQNWINQLD